MAERQLRAPFPWFGGKARAAHLVWEALGDCSNYIEPFAGSLAVLLARPHAPRIETVNDVDHYLSNFWRALQREPEAVAEHADWPASEVDLHARHAWLVAQTDFRARMEADPEFYDAQVAGWWVWGISLWIGSGWCSQPGWKGRGHAGAAPRGIHGQQVREAPGVWRQKPDLSGSRGAAGRGVHASGRRGGVREWMADLAERLRYVRVCCGDFARVLTPSVTTQIGDTGILVDPPYRHEGRDPSVYTHDQAQAAERAWEWACANGNNPRLRIVLCGYEGNYSMPAGWRCVEWEAAGGYSAARGDGENAARERLWLSPQCLSGPKQADLFEALEGRP